MFILAIDQIKLNLSMFILGILRAVIPFGPFVYDKKLKQIGEKSA